MADDLKKITVDPKVLGGKPVIKGTRIAVELVLDKLAQGIGVEEILVDYPGLTVADVHAAVYYAKNLVDRENYYPLAA